jgi:hypothetical protein
LIRLWAGLAVTVVLLVCTRDISRAQIPAGGDIGFTNGAVSGRCVATDQKTGVTSLRVLNGGSAALNGVAIIALNLSSDVCVSLNTPPGAVQVATRRYGAGCAALYYLVWKEHMRDPWFYWLGPADAHALMCTADTLATTSTLDGFATANTGTGTETAGVSLMTKGYLDHVYSIVCDDFDGKELQKWSGPDDSGLVFSANRLWSGQPAGLPCYISERRLKLPGSTGTESAKLSTSSNWVEFIAAFRTLQAPVPRQEGDVAGIALTKYAGTLFADLAKTFTADGQTGYCSDCDPPHTPPRACTSKATRTGAYVHRLHGVNYCTY